MPESIGDYILYILFLLSRTTNRVDHVVIPVQFESDQLLQSLLERVTVGLDNWHQEKIDFTY